MSDQTQTQTKTQTTPTESHTDIFPDQIISEILTRLPAKSVHRFKLVSKRWLSLITTPHFLSSYISHHSPPSSSVKLDRVIRYPADSTQLTQVKHSKVYTLSINPTLLLKPDEPITHPDRYPVPAEVIQTSGGLILFAVNICPHPMKYGIEGFASLPWRQRMERRPTGGFNVIYGADPTEDVLFVTNPVTSHWARIPRAPNYILHRKGYAFTTRLVPETGVGEFVVAVFEDEAGRVKGGMGEEGPWMGPPTATVTCYSSETDMWVKKRAGYPLGERAWFGHDAFEVRGRVVWPDVSVGLMVWEEDPFVGARSDDETEFVFVPLPIGRERGKMTVEMMSLRYFDRAGETVQYTEVFEEGEVGLEVWRLRGYGVDQADWHKVYTVGRVVIDGCFGGRFREGCVSFVDPVEEDTVVLATPEHVVSLDVRNQVVRSRSSFVGHTIAMAFVFSAWPAALSPPLYAAFAKEEGNKYFKGGRLDEAISWYSRSITMLPNALAYANRAMAYLKVHKFHEAEDDCSSALMLDGDFFKVYARRAIARKELGDFGGSLEDIEHALRLQPENEEMKKQYAQIKSLVEKVSSKDCEDDCGGDYLT